MKQAVAAGVFVGCIYLPLLSQYIIRNTFSSEKLKYDAGDSSVIYRSRQWFMLPTYLKNKFGIKADSTVLGLKIIVNIVNWPGWSNYYKQCKKL